MVLFAAIILLLFPILPFGMLMGRIRGGNFMYRLFRGCANIWMVLIGIRHTTTYESKPDPNEQYIFVANDHLSSETTKRYIPHHVLNNIQSANCYDYWLE